MLQTFSNVLDGNEERDEEAEDGIDEGFDIDLLKVFLELPKY